MESIYPGLALCDINNLSATTDTVFTESQELGTLSRYHNSCSDAWLLGCLSVLLSVGRSKAFIGGWRVVRLHGKTN